MPNINPSFKLAELIKDLDVTLNGDPDTLITAVAPIQRAQSGHITFLTNPLYKKYLVSTGASAVVLTAEDAKDCIQRDGASPIATIVSANPYFIYAKIAGHFAKDLTKSESGIHPTAIIAADAEIHPSASIGAFCQIGQGVKIEQHVTIGPGCIIDAHAQIGKESRLEARVTVCHSVKIGQRVNLASGVVLGSEGFGFANHKGSWHKVPQLGSVIIGDDVDIGANTTIDRGAVEDTIIEDGVKLDNLIQIGHNVRIGANTIIAGCVAIAGSTVIGKNCMIGGASCFNGHITIADKVIITGMSAVTKSIPEAGMYASGVVGVVPYQEFRKNNARFHRLENLIQRVKKLESVLNVFNKEKK